MNEPGKTILFILALAVFSGMAKAEELVVLNTRTDVTQSFILIKTAKPKASVILFAGGKGNLELSSDGGTAVIGRGKNNFLVRSRKLFAEQGFMVAVVDAPSDQKSSQGMKGGFRATAAHVEDINEVIKYLRKQAAVTVWLIGTSRGTESAAYIAYNSKQKPDGLILTSSMAAENKYGTTVTDMPLEKIKIPVFVVAHEEDDCWVTPPIGALVIMDKLVNSKRKSLKMFTGGDEPISSACKARSYHGFLGIEKNVVKHIAEFITAQ